MTTVAGESDVTVPRENQQEPEPKQTRAIEGDLSQAAQKELAELRQQLKDAEDELKNQRTLTAQDHQLIEQLQTSGAHLEEEAFRIQTRLQTDLRAEKLKSEDRCKAIETLKQGCLDISSRDCFKEQYIQLLEAHILQRKTFDDALKAEICSLLDDHPDCHPECHPARAPIVGLPVEYGRGTGLEPPEVGFQYNIAQQPSSGGQGGPGTPDAVVRKGPFSRGSSRPAGAALTTRKPLQEAPGSIPYSKGGRAFIGDPGKQAALAAAFEKGKPKPWPTVFMPFVAPSGSGAASGTASTGGPFCVGKGGLYTGGAWTPLPPGTMQFSQVTDPRKKGKKSKRMEMPLTQSPAQNGPSPVQLSSHTPPATTPAVLGSLPNMSKQSQGGDSLIKKEAVTKPEVRHSDSTEAAAAASAQPVVPSQKPTASAEPVQPADHSETAAENDCAPTPDADAWLTAVLSGAADTTADEPDAALTAHVATGVQKEEEVAAAESKLATEDVSDTAAVQNVCGVTQTGPANAQGAAPASELAAAHNAVGTSRGMNPETKQKKRGREASPKLKEGVGNESSPLWVSEEPASKRQHAAAQDSTVVLPAMLATGPLPSDSPQQVTGAEPLGNSACESQPASGLEQLSQAAPNVSNTPPATAEQLPQAVPNDRNMSSRAAEQTAETGAGVGAVPVTPRKATKVVNTARGRKAKRSRGVWEDLQAIAFEERTGCVYNDGEGDVYGCNDMAPPSKRHKLNTGLRNDMQAEADSDTEGVSESEPESSDTGHADSGDEGYDVAKSAESSVGGNW